MWILRLSLISVAITVAVMILASSLIKGFQSQISEKVFGFWGHIHVNNLAISRSFESTPIQRDSAFIQSLYDIASISSTDKEGNVTETKGGITHVQSSALLPGIIDHDGQFEGVVLKGVGDDFNWDYLSQFLKSGEVIQINDQTPSNEIIISQQTSQRIGLEVGDDFRMSFVIDGRQIPRKFKVKGIYKTGLEEYDKKFVIGDIRKIQQLLQWDSNQIGTLEIFVEHLDDAPLLTDYIYFNMIEDGGLYAESIKEKFPNIFEWLKLQGINEKVILGLMIMVCILNMATTLLILILERTHMIGVLKAMGARNWTIRKIFLTHGLYILSWGVIIGNVIGIGLALLQQHFGIIQLKEEDYYLSTAPIELSWVYIIVINIITIGITLCFLILPSYLVTRISPMKAIKMR